MTDVFISYHVEDQSKAALVAQSLESEGYSVWYDRQLRAGESFAQIIETAINKAKAVIVLWSKTSVNSAWVADEASYGAQAQKLIPVLLDRVDIPLGFRAFHHVGLEDWRGERTDSEWQAV